MSLDERSKLLRRYVIDAMRGGGRGHLGSSMSMIEILRVLYDSILSIDPKNPQSIDRDRFILSKGHGCLALYAILADRGFFPINELESFCRPTSILGGHPERGKIPGVEASTGALGHGLPIGVGISVAMRLAGNASRVFVLTGDGEINEGSNWEALMAAAKHKLSNLTVIVDYNKLQSYGRTVDVLDLEPLKDKFTSFGLATHEVDGHDLNALESIFKKLPFEKDSPSAIICHTIKGKGFPFAEGNPEWHHKSGMTESDIQQMYDCLR